SRDAGRRRRRDGGPARVSFRCFARFSSHPCRVDVHGPPSHCLRLPCGATGVRRHGAELPDMHPGGGLMSLRLLIALLSVLLIGIFSTQNHKLVVISFLAWEWMLSLALVIIASAVLGALFVGALGLIRQFHSGRRLRALQK